MASNEQKTKLPQQRSRGQSRNVETTIIVGDVGHESAQLVLKNLPKAAASSSSVQHIVKTATPPSTSVSQSTSGVMTGVEPLLIYNEKSLNFNLRATSAFRSLTSQLCIFIAFLWFLALPTRKPKYSRMQFLCCKKNS